MYKLQCSLCVEAATNAPVDIAKQNFGGINMFFFLNIFTDIYFGLLSFDADIFKVN